jgi:molybdopterin synthase sulfur carrier subunit
MPDLVYFSCNTLLEGLVGMDVNFYATLRAIVGKKTVHVDLPPNTTALQLVEMVSAEYPALRAELLDAQNRFQRHMKMFINGREAVYLDQQFDTIIKPSDKVDIFPPVGGG